MSVEVFTLQGKVALVMGASNGMGRAIALALAEAGADTALASVRQRQQETEALSLCLSEVQARRRKGFAQTIDASNEDHVNALVQRTVAELGKLNILINIQDLPFAKPVGITTIKEWQRVLDVNLTGPYLACRAAFDQMLTQGQGRIINVVSLLGERGMANGSAYCAAQGGVLNLTRALALEWARTGITVNAIGAGWVQGTGILVNEVIEQQLTRYIPQKRAGHPEEVASAAVYLAADASGFVTGQVLWIDGGMRTRL